MTGEVSFNIYENGFKIKKWSINVYILSITPLRFFVPTPISFWRMGFRRLCVAAVAVSKCSLTILPTLVSFALKPYGFYILV